MKKVYMLSGSYTKRVFPEDAMNDLNEELKKESTLAFIPTNFDDHDNNLERVNKIIQMFKNSNVEFKEGYLIDNQVTKEEAIEIMKKSDVVFLTGGNPLEQIDGINNLDIRDAIKEYGKIIVGMSAGSMNMASKVLLAKDEEEDIPETVVYDGIGLTDINIEPHCDFENKEHWQDLLEASKINKIYCMVDNCSIVIKGSETKIYGNYCIINNGEIEFDNRNDEQVNN